jgi:hypothetical protein
MDVMFTHWAGLDMHKKTVMACRVPPDPPGRKPTGSWSSRNLGR